MFTAKYVTSQGVEIEIIPFPPEKERLIRATGKYPKPPYYEYQNVAGEVQRVYHTEKSIRTPEEREEWEKYKKARFDAVFEVESKIINLIINKYVKVKLPDNNDWINEQIELGISVPVDPEELRKHYFYTECIGNPGEARLIMDYCLSLNKYSQERFREAESVFLSNMEKDGSDAQ